MKEKIEELVMPKEKRMQEWWVPRLLPRERLVLLAAQGGTGKTSFSFYLADFFTKLGLRTEDDDPIRVAYWSFEDEPQDFVNKVGYNEDVVFIRWDSDKCFGEEDDDIAILEKYLFERNVHILIIDPISALLDDDGNNNQAVRKLLNKMLKMTSEIGVTILGIHHFRKDSISKSIRGSIMGASAWVDTARHVLSLVRDNDGRTFLEIAKSNIARVGISWEIFTSIDEYGYHVTGFEQVEDGSAQAALKGELIEAPVIQGLKSEFDIGQLFNLDDVDRLGSKASFYRWIKNNSDKIQESTKKKDGKKAWIFI